MASTRDQVDAYTHEVRRQVTSLLRGEDTGSADPRRRLNRALVGGAVLAVLIMAGAGVVGFLGGGGGDELPESGAIVVEGTGERYVLIDQVLHPALNLASAVLVGGGDIATVDADALAGIPRGLPVGILGAPDALPDPAAMQTGQWTVCAVAARAQSARPEVTLLIGADPAEPIPTGTAVTVTDPGGGLWLLTGGYRYAVPDLSQPLLGLDPADAQPVPAEVVNLVPEAPALSIDPLPGAGTPPSASLPVQANVGDVIDAEIAGGRHSYYVVLDDGLAQVSPLAYTLLAGNATNRLSADAGVATLPQSSRTAPVSEAWPEDLPAVVEPQRRQPLCLSYDPAAPERDAAWPVQLSLPDDVPTPAGQVPVAPLSGQLPTAVTGVVISPGSGAFVRATGSGGVDAVLTLVTDAGLRFPVTSADAATRLGYDQARAVGVPLPFVSLLPSGPALDPLAAAREYAGPAAPAPPN